MTTSTLPYLVACGCLLLGLAGCGSSEGKDPQASPTASRTVTASTAAAETSTYSDRRQKLFEADGADAMVAEAGALWVKTDLGHVYRIDPQTNRIAADVVVDKRTGEGFYCQGIGAVAGSVWSCATRVDGVGVAQIDPTSDRITRVVPVGKVYDQIGLPSTPRGVWVLTKDGTEASVVDPTSGKVTSYPLGARCQQMAAAGSRVVATSLVDNTVVVLDADSGAVRERLAVPTARMAALVGDEIWVDSADGLTRFSHGLSTRTLYPGMTAGRGGDLFYDGTSVWLRGSDGTISRMDAESGKVLERITPTQPASAGSLVVAFGSIWTTDSEEGRIIRLRQ